MATELSVVGLTGLAVVGLMAALARSAAEQEGKQAAKERAERAHWQASSIEFLTSRAASSAMNVTG